MTWLRGLIHKGSAPPGVLCVFVFLGEGSTQQKPEVNGNVNKETSLGLALPGRVQCLI